MEREAGRVTEGKGLPHNIIPISSLRIRRDKDKKCTCADHKYDIDPQNKEVSCAGCGTIVQPFDALLDIAYHYEMLTKEAEALLEQRRQILDWKPHLLPLRRVEGIYRSGQMLPCCPHCGRGILAEELPIASVNKQSEMERRKFDKRGLTR